MDRSKSKTRLVYNTVLGGADKILICVLGLVLRRVFLDNLGAELSGLSSLFQNIIEFLNLATAGFITAIYPRLYRYNAENDYENIRKVMRMSKQFYYLVATAILVMGMICSLFVNHMIHENQYTLTFLRIVFLIQVLTQCVRMLSAPNVALLSAREQGYYNILFDIGVNLFIYLSQMAVVIKTQNYIYYLLFGLLGYTIYIIALDIKVKQLYPWVRAKVLGRFERITDLFLDIKHTVIMQIANFIFCSTDSIVISKSIGLVQVNAYGNYMTITTAILAIYTSFDTAIRNYFGNKLAVDSSQKAKKEFLHTVTFLFYLIGTVCAVGYICLIGPFVRLWVGDTYVQSRFIDVLFGLYIFTQILFNGPPEYLQILGIFDKDMSANISSAIINLILSILLVQKIGIAGVLIGTLVGLTVRFVQRTISSFRNIGNGGMKFFGEIVVYSLSFGGILFLAETACRKITVADSWMGLIIKGIVVVCISVFANLILYIRKKELRMLAGMISEIVRYRRKA